MRWKSGKVVFVSMLMAMPLQAQRADGLRAGVAKLAPVPTVQVEKAEGVSRKSLGIGAGVGAVVGGVIGGAVVNNSEFGKNEAWPLFVGAGALVGALIGAGLGMAVTAFIL